MKFMTAATVQNMPQYLNHFRAERENWQKQAKERKLEGQQKLIADMGFDMRQALNEIPEKERTDPAALARYLDQVVDKYRSSKYFTPQALEKAEQLVARTLQEGRAHDAHTMLQETHNQNKQTFDKNLKKLELEITGFNRNEDDIARRRAISVKLGTAKTPEELDIMLNALSFDDRAYFKNITNAQNQTDAKTKELVASAYLKRAQGDYYKSGAGKTTKPITATQLQMATDKAKSIIGTLNGATFGEDRLSELNYVGLPTNNKGDLTPEANDVVNQLKDMGWSLQKYAPMNQNWLQKNNDSKIMHYTLVPNFSSGTALGTLQTGSANAGQSSNSGSNSVSDETANKSIAERINGSNAEYKNTWQQKYTDGRMPSPPVKETVLQTIQQQQQPIAIKQPFQGDKIVPLRKAKIFKKRPSDPTQDYTKKEYRAPSALKPIIASKNKTGSLNAIVNKSKVKDDVQSAYTFYVQNPDKAKADLQDLRDKKQKGYTLNSLEVEMLRILESMFME